MIRRKMAAGAVTIGHRHVYVAAKAKATARVSPLQKIERQLDSQLDDLRVYHEELKQVEKAQQEKADRSWNNHNYAEPASDEDLAAVEASVHRGPVATSRKLSQKQLAKLPASIELKLRPAHSMGLVLSVPDWGATLAVLRKKGLDDVPVEDVEELFRQMPLQVRANFATEWESLVPNPTPQVVNRLIAGYAHKGDTVNVERLFAAAPLKTKSLFGHLAKAYFKANNKFKVLEVLTRMNRASLEPTLFIYTNVIQACIQNRDYPLARQIFDNLKYMAAATLPDVKLYNSMMLVASKEHNVLKVLDLYKEMRTRPVKPLLPNAETYNILVYACARDSSTHFEAWRYFVEMLDAGFAAGRETMNALLYLCGQSGELLLARALIRQLCLNPESYPDSFALTCLMKAYMTHEPTQNSSVLTGPFGSKIRTKILFQSFEECSSDLMPPFLPLTALDPHMMLAEANALIDFFAEKAPGSLLVSDQASAATNSPPVFIYLRLAAKLGGIDDFKRVYSKHTVEDSVLTAPVLTLGPIQIPRNSHVFRVALLAAGKFRDLEYARRIWEERGAWRKSVAFQSLPEVEQERLDYRFARDMIQVFVASGETQDAMDLVNSTTDRFRWLKAHLEPLINALVEQEDIANLEHLRMLVQAQHKLKDRLLHGPK